MQDTTQTFSKALDEQRRTEKLDSTLRLNMGTKPTDRTIIISSSTSPYAIGEERVIVQYLEAGVAAHPVILFETSGEKVISSLGTLPPKALNMLRVILSKK